MLHALLCISYHFYSLLKLVFIIKILTEMHPLFNHYLTILLFFQLWNTLRPETKLESRISHQWTEIGFQGDDPMTDFRGMGLLSLQNLMYVFLLRGGPFFCAFFSNFKLRFADGF